MVEDIPEAASQLRDIELLGPVEAVLLGDREQQLNSGWRGRADESARELDQHRDRGLVVGSENALVGIRPAAIDPYWLDRGEWRDRVHVRAEKQALARPTGGALARPTGRARHPREQVARVCADDRPGAVLVDVETALAQLGCHPVGARALVAGRALDRAQGGERLV